MKQIAVYGAPPPRLAPVPSGATQLSPRVPGAQALEALDPESLDALVIAAPDGVVERRHVIAAGLRLLRVGGDLTVLAPKTKGGSRLAKELAAFGCDPTEDYGGGWRICRVARPAQVIGLEAAIEDGQPRRLVDLGWTQPGLFSWNRLDPGSALLGPYLRELKGEGADLGCGGGVLARFVLTSPAVTSLLLVDIDRRAVEATKRNVEDGRAKVLWADSLSLEGPTDLDFVVMNPPFHDGGAEDKRLGVAFIRTAARLLRRGGRLLLVANRHLPYEAPLGELFTRFSPLADQGGFKVIEAVK